MRRHRFTTGAAVCLGVFGAALIALAFMVPGLPSGPTPSSPGAVRAEPNHGAADPESSASTIRVPDVGLRASVVDTTDRDGYLVLPDPPHVARYVRTAPLGAGRGSTVVAGHVNFANGSLAPMAGLARVAIGSPVFVTDTLGVEYRYRVVRLQNSPKTALSPATFDADGPAQLILMTCDQNSPLSAIGGIVQYTDNTVATAVPWP